MYPSERIELENFSVLYFKQQIICGFLLYIIRFVSQIIHFFRTEISMYLSERSERENFSVKYSKTAIHLQISVGTLYILSAQ